MKVSAWLTAAQALSHDDMPEADATNVGTGEASSYFKIFPIPAVASRNRRRKALFTLSRGDARTDAEFRAAGVIPAVPF
jgi:DNA helicase HerA-like ATPase